MKFVFPVINFVTCKDENEAIKLQKKAINSTGITVTFQTHKLPVLPLNKHPPVHHTVCACVCVCVQVEDSSMCNSLGTLECSSCRCNDLR